MNLFKIQKFAWQLLSRKDRKRYSAALVIQASLSIFEILGIALAGLIGLLVSNNSSSTYVLSFRKIITNFGFQNTPTLTLELFLLNKVLPNCSLLKIFL